LSGGEGGALLWTTPVPLNLVTSLLMVLSLFT